MDGGVRRHTRSSRRDEPARRPISQTNRQLDSTSPDARTLSRSMGPPSPPAMIDAATGRGRCCLCWALAGGKVSGMHRALFHERARPSNGSTNRANRSSARPAAPTRRLQSAPWGCRSRGGAGGSCRWAACLWPWVQRMKKATRERRGGTRTATSPRRRASAPAALPWLIEAYGRTTRPTLPSGRARSTVDRTRPACESVPVARGGPAGRSCRAFGRRLLRPAS